MDTVLLLARLFLAGVFALSGITKLADLDGSRRAVAGFGVPERIARPAGIALPIAELVLAILLLPVSTAWWAALGALLLLVGFIAGIGYNLRKGRTPDCHCFGKVHSEPIGPATLVRDGAFAAVAAIIVLFGRDDAGASLTSWFGDLSGAEQALTIATALLTAAVAGLAWLLLQVVRQNGRLLLRLEALEAAFAVNPRLRGYVLDEQGAVRKHVAVFLNGDMLPRETALAQRVAGEDRVMVIQALTGG